MFEDEFGGTTLSGQNDPFLGSCEETERTFFDIRFDDGHEQEGEHIGGFQQVNQYASSCLNELMDSTEVTNAFTMHADFNEHASIGFEQELFEVQLSPEMNLRSEEDWRLGEIIEKVAAGSSPSPPQFPKKKAKSSVLRTKTNMITKPKVGNQFNTNTIALDVLKLPVRMMPVMAMQNNLFPVKVKQVLSSQPTRKFIGRSSYELGPIPPKPRRCYSRESSSSDADSIKENSTTPNKMTSPRDNQSNNHCCTFCRASFPTELAMEFHLVMRHGAFHGYECDLCKNVYVDIHEANRHLIEDHSRKLIPLLDKSVFGNEDFGKKKTARRISSMIQKFLETYIVRKAETIKTETKYDVLSKVVKAAMNRTGNSKENADDTTSSDESNKTLAENFNSIEDSSSINDLLKKEYIYGPYLRRVILSTVSKEKIIWTRYKSSHNFIPNLMPSSNTEPAASPTPMQSMLIPGTNVMYKQQTTQPLMPPLLKYVLPRDDISQP